MVKLMNFMIILVLCYSSQLTSASAHLQFVDGQMPDPNFNFPSLALSFAAKGFTVEELVALSKAHTISASHCELSTSTLTDFGVDTNFSSTVLSSCDPAGYGSVSLDSKTPNVFDNNYLSLILAQQGHLRSDKELVEGAKKVVSQYVTNQSQFFRDFSVAMVKLSSLSPLRRGRNDQSQLQIRCEKPPKPITRPDSFNCIGCNVYYFIHPFLI